jgi:hypothetical protein
MAKTQPLSSKILVTNRAALVGKYGTAGVKDIEKAVDGLIRADGKRGLKTRLIYLDGGALKRRRVKDPADPVENKAAVDAVARKHRPEYLVILGSHDVVPYQDLKNKLHEAGDPDSDPDRFAPSDLPYACEAPYSQSAAKFLGPTRVVGRIPDLTGATRPTYLIRLLASFAKAKGLKRPESAFALSAKVWEKSTKTSIRNILGAVPTVLTSPKKGPRFGKAALGAKVHFVNCHGDKEDHTFAGEFPEERYFTAVDARKLRSVGRGTVAAFECCYGAQLYDPADLPAMSIANTYLARGAAGVVASTTVSYGLEDTPANADVICQLFIEQVLNGASLGRAFLEARQDYLREQSVADAYDEKTLAQFVLLGDPSLHPFPAAMTPGVKASPKAKASQVAARLQRRVRLMKTGQRLGRETAFTVKSKRGGGTQAKALSAARRRFKNLRSFTVHEPAAARQSVGKALSSMPHATHVFVAMKPRRKSMQTRNVPIFDAFLAYQVKGEMVEINLVSK